MKKTIISLISIAMSIVATFTVVHGNTMDDTSETVGRNEVVNELNNTQNFSQIIGHESLRVDSKEIQQNVTFENQEEALNNFKNKFSKELKIIRNASGLPPLSNDNYIDYYDFVRINYENNILSYDQSSEILAFFDIYENVEENQEIADNVETYVNTGNLEKLQTAKDIAPEFNNNLQYSTRSIALPNLTNAINYAKQYAVNYNGYKRYWRDHDCTNFVSQILNSAGVGMVNTGNQNTGWWYSGGIFDYNSQSVSWINADTFSRYMGRTRYTSWTSLVRNLKAGDFIACDYGGDGVVDHMGFVTSKISTGVVMIAQHSINYHRRSDETGWKADENTAKKWYMVR